jgi:hypothetical protein
MPKEEEQEEDDDETFVPEDLRDYSSAPRRPIYPGPHAVLSMSDHMDGLHAVDQTRREHEEELANWPHTYDTYLCTFTHWYHNRPEPSRSDELNVTRDDDNQHLFREFLTDVVKLLPVPEDEQEAWVVAVLDKLFQIDITTIRECLQDIMLINSRLIRIGGTPLFHRTLNIIVQRSVKILVPDPPLPSFPRRSSSSDEAYHVSLTTERSVPSTTLKQVVPMQYAHKQTC